MRARITLLLLFAILFSFTCLAQTNFEKHFTKKSLRIDFALSGNWDFQAAAIQQLREEPVSIRLVMEGIILMYMIKPVKS